VILYSGLNFYMLLGILVLSVFVLVGILLVYWWCTKPSYTPGKLLGLSPRIVSQKQLSDKESQWITDDGIQLYSFCEGHGSSILYVHGGPVFPLCHLPAGFKPLCNSFQFHMYHLRGCGHSSRPVTYFEKQGGRHWRENSSYLISKLGVETQLLDIERIRKVLGQETLTLVGHSFGGFLATMYACEYPNNVKSLILVSPANVLITSEGLFGAVKSNLSGNNQTAYSAFLKEYLNFSASLFEKTEKQMKDLNNELSSWVDRALAFGGGRSTNLEMTGGFLSHALYLGIGARRDYRSYLSKISAPTLVIHGENDPVQNAPTTKMYADLIKHSTFVILPGVGHFSFNEAPDKFSAVVKEFLNNQNQSERVKQ